MSSERYIHRDLGFAIFLLAFLFLVDSSFDSIRDK